MDYCVNLGEGEEKLTIHVISGPMRQICIFFALIMEKTASGLDYHDWKFLKVREHVFVLIKGTSFFVLINLHRFWKVILG